MSYTKNPRSERTADISQNLGTELCFYIVRCLVGICVVTDDDLPFFSLWKKFVLLVFFKCDFALLGNGPKCNFCALNAYV